MANGTLAASQIEMLSQSGTGIITITPPATNTNRAITLPDSAGAIVVSGTTPALNGITFPATQVASADANTLDDYEEGTWTPAFSVNGFNNSATLSSYTAKYTKIGRSVTISCELNMSTACRPTSYILITGVPFTSGSNFVGTYDGTNPGNGNQGGSASLGVSGWYWTPMAETNNSQTWLGTVTYFV